MFSKQWIILIDLGPEGGDEGGMVVAHGTPDQVSRVKESYTGRYLVPYFHQLGTAYDRRDNNNQARSR